jgi:hypothetical protein
MCVIRVHITKSMENKLAEVAAAVSHLEIKWVYAVELNHGFLLQRRVLNLSRCILL